MITHESTTKDVTGLAYGKWAPWIMGNLMKWNFYQVILAAAHFRQVWDHGILSIPILMKWVPEHLQSSWRYRHGLYRHDGVSNRRGLDCFLNRFFRCGSMKTSKLPVTGLCEMNPPVTGWLPSQRANNADKISILWRHRGFHNYLKQWH